MQQTIRQLLSEGVLGADISVSGFVRTRRDSKGGFSFLEINDGSTVKNIQAIVPNTLPNYADGVLRAGTGSAVTVHGVLVASTGKEQSVEIDAKIVEIHGFAPADYPLQKKHHTLEFLRQIPHLRARTNTIGCVTRVRSRLTLAIHRFFQGEDFHLVHTPIITTSDCEGAGQLFRVNVDGIKEEFFGKPAHLTVSGQLEGECYSMAMGRIYTFGPTFRAENSNTSRHLSEFWMVEPEVAFMDLCGDMALAERFIKYLVNDVLNNCKDELSFFDERVSRGIRERIASVAESVFTSITYTDAITILEKSASLFSYPVKWGCDLQSEHERFLTEQVFKAPVIVTDYPKGIKAFYMRLNDDGKTVRAMDVLVPGVGEIIGGSQREERLLVLESRMEELNLPKENYERYLDLRRFGTVPHSGFGMGFERFIQYITGLENIRDVIPFPRTPGNAD